MIVQQPQTWHSMEYLSLQFTTTSAPPRTGTSDVPAGAGSRRSFQALPPVTGAIWVHRRGVSCGVPICRCRSFRPPELNHPHPRIRRPRRALGVDGVPEINKCIPSIWIWIAASARLMVSAFQAPSIRDSLCPRVLFRDFLQPLNANAGDFEGDSGGPTGHEAG